MSFRIGLTVGVIFGLAISAMAFLGWLAFGKPATSKAAPAKPPPASVAKIAKEDEFNTLTLTAKAVERLALRTKPVASRPMPQVRIYGGEVLIPTGNSLQVAAPVSGVLRALPRTTKTGNAVQDGPLVGDHLEKGDVLFELTPLLSPDSQTTLAAGRVDAIGQVNNAQTQVEAARIALERAKRLVKQDAGSQRNVDDAQAQFDLAVQTHEAAKARRELFDKALADAARGIATPLKIESPQSGLVRVVGVRNGQNIPAGTVLVEVADLTQVWVRVPVYVGEVELLDREAAAQVGVLSARPGSSRTPARSTAAPPSANPLSATVDLYYAIDNSQNAYWPGQRVSVEIPETRKADALVVPWSAVVIDVHGGMWVYIEGPPLTYSRRRVHVQYVVGKLAVLKEGPAKGTPVVVDGAAELFGTEVGHAK